MHGFDGERTLMRIYVGERDKCHGQPLSEAIVMMRRNRHAGVTVLRAIMGFGAGSRLRSDRIEVLSTDLPIVIECVETADRIQAVHPELDTVIGGGLVTLERATVIMDRPSDQAARAGTTGRAIWAAPNGVVATVPRPYDDGGGVLVRHVPRRAPC